MIEASTQRSARPSQRSEWGRDVLLEVQEWSGGLDGGLERVWRPSCKSRRDGRPYRWSGRSHKALPEIRVGLGHSLRGVGGPCGGPGGHAKVQEGL